MGGSCVSPNLCLKAGRRAYKSFKGGILSQLSNELSNGTVAVLNQKIEPIDWKYTIFIFGLFFDLFWYFEPKWGVLVEPLTFV